MSTMRASGRMPSAAGARPDRAARMPTREHERDHREAGAADHEANGADRQGSGVVGPERLRRAGRAEQQRRGEDGEDVKHPPVLQAPSHLRRTGSAGPPESRPGSADAPPVGWCGDTRYLARRLYDTKAQALRDFVPLDPSERHGLRLRSHRAVRSAHRPPPRRAELRHPAPLARAPATVASRSCATSPTSTTRCSRTRPTPSRGGRSRIGWSWSSRTRMPRSASAPPTYEPRATASIPQMQELIERLIDAGHAYAAAGDVYFDVRSWGEYGDAHAPVARRHGAGTGRRSSRQARPARLRPLEGREARRARDRATWDVAVGTRPARLAHRVLRDVAALPRTRVRHPRRRTRPALPAPRERAGAVDRRR